jgi:hypothetical protein
MIDCSNDVENSFQAERIERTASFVVNAPVDKSFPLFGPIREKEWAAGWEPSVLLSKDILIEEHMIFQTNGQEGEGNYTWAVTTFQPEKHLVEYTVFTSERIWFIRVACEAVGEKTNATVSYAYTGLTEEGNRKNKLAIEKMYANNLNDWEKAINHYLEMSQQLVEN